MKEHMARVKEALDYVRTKTDHEPKIGIILGTGLGSLVEGLTTTATVSYKDIPHMPVSTVESHAGELLFGTLSDKPVVCMRGRFHFYEGYDMKQITFPVRLMKLLGIEALIVSNAAGGMNPNFKAGDIMVIKDHINHFPSNPLLGPNDDSVGDRFPDMYEVYNQNYVTLAKEVALEQNLRLQEGVYVGLTGPCLETSAEYRFFRTIGADAVGMSTVPEVIAAHHQRNKILAFSIITDMGLADNMHPCSLEDVIRTASQTEPKLRDLISGCVARM